MPDANAYLERYNQLMWQMDRLREEIDKVNKDYVSRLRDIRKNMQRTSDELADVGRRMGPRAQLHLTPGQHSGTDAGFQFHPPAA